MAPDHPEHRHTITIKLSVYCTPDTYNRERLRMTARRWALDAPSPFGVVEAVHQQGDRVVSLLDPAEDGHYMTPEQVAARAKQASDAVYRHMIRGARRVHVDIGREELEYVLDSDGPGGNLPPR